MARLCVREQWQTCDCERGGAERGRMTASRVRMCNAIGAAGDEEGDERLRCGIDDRSRSMQEQGVERESIWLLAEGVRKESWK